MTARTPAMLRPTKARSAIEPTRSVNGDGLRSSPRAGFCSVRNVRISASPRWPALPVTSTVIVFLRADGFQEFTDRVGDQFGGVRGHVMAGSQQLVARAGNDLRGGLAHRGRARVVELAADHQHRA